MTRAKLKVMQVGLFLYEFNAAFNFFVLLLTSVCFNCLHFINGWTLFCIIFNGSCDINYFVIVCTGITYEILVKQSDIY